MKKYFVILLLSLTNCSFLSDGRTINVVIDTHQAGWYFLEIIRDTTAKNSGTITVLFNGRERCHPVTIVDIDKTIVHPVDFKGNDISSRLKFFGVRRPYSKKSFFQFYNPTDDELANISHWDPTDPRSEKISSNGDNDFRKCYDEK